MELENKTYEIYFFDFGHPSFNWANGEYIILGEHDSTTINICRIENGKPEIYDDGSISYSCTGKRSKEQLKLMSTGKFYKDSETTYKSRKDKLKRILR